MRAQGPYEILELTDRAMEPMVQALKPLKNHSDWLWDFHINGQSRSLKYELHKQPRTARNITNAEYHQDLLDGYDNTMQSLIGGLTAQSATAGGRRSSAGHRAAASSRQTCAQVIN